MKPKLNNKGSLIGDKLMDQCLTPFYAVGPLLPYLDKSAILWDGFFAGGFQKLRASMPVVLQHYYNITFSGIVWGQNFFNYEPDKWDIFVTNPAYSIKFSVLKRCYELGKPFALLLPVEVLGAKTAQVMFEKYGMEVILLNKRVDFYMPKKGFKSSAQFPTCWITSGLNIGRDITYGKLNKPSKKEMIEIWEGTFNGK